MYLGREQGPSLVTYFTPESPWNNKNDISCHSLEENDITLFKSQCQKPFSFEDSIIRRPIGDHR